MSKFKVGDRVKFIGDSIKHGFSDELIIYKDDLVVKCIRNNTSIQVMPKNLGIPIWLCEVNELELVEPVDDSVDAMRYCISDLIITNNCCEKIKEEKYMSDIMKIYENKKRNEVLELWYEKKKHKIIDKYDKLEEEFNKKQYSVVESFNELVEQFNKDLDGLFQFDKASEQFVLKENAPSNVYKYKIDYDKLRDEFVDKYIKKRNKELNKVEEEYAEIKAQLSLSDDLDYQIEILNRYGILNKKTKKISD